jgi:hypothetical protein
MLIVLPVALALLASEAPAAAVAGSGVSAAPAPQASSETANAAAPAQSCPGPSGNDREIIICTQRPQGYRLNPDVMEARREMRSGGRPPRPGGTIRPDCATVGPAPCVNAGINLLGAAATAAEMAARLAKGQEIGSMFVTDPHPTEYQLYLMAKAEREAREAEKAAKAAAAKTKTAARPAPPAAGPAARD